MKKFKKTYNKSKEIYLNQVDRKIEEDIDRGDCTLTEKNVLQKTLYKTPI